MSTEIDAQWQAICDGVKARLDRVPALPTLVPQALPVTAEAS